MRIREAERVNRALRAFDASYRSKSAHLQEALMTGRQRAEALERRADRLAMELETLGPRARERAVKKYFDACEREGYSSEEAREAMRAAGGARKEARRRRSEEMDVPDYHQDRAPGPKPREDEEDEEGYEGPRFRDDDDDDDDDSDSDSDEEDE